MAKNNMTFNASIRLNSAQFKKGVADVQRSIKSLQNSFLSLGSAIGLGLSFSRLGSSLLDTATKLSDAKDVLGNVSKGIGEYGQNLEWLRGVANKYGQDMTELIKTFSQFRAAAQYSKLSIGEVRDVFESLTRASGAFNLSADKTNAVMRTVGQMLSKGIIDNQRYVKQLNTALPGAYNMMAQAAYNAGLITENSVEALEKAIKDGKILADKVLPSFSKVLDDVTQNATFDTLQNSVNRLKNSWSEMVESANFEGMYKGLIDGANNVVKYFTEGFWTRISTIFAGIAAIIASPRISASFSKFIQDTKTARAAAEKEFNRLYHSIGEQYQKIGNMPGGGAVHGTAVPGQSFGGAKGQMRGARMQWIDPTVLKYLRLEKDQVLSLQKAVVKYNDDLLTLSKTQKEATGKAYFDPQTTAMIERVNGKLKEQIRLTEEGSDAFQNFNSNAGLGRTAMQKFGQAARTALSMVGAALQSIAIGLVIAGITNIISQLVQARKEAKRIAGIADEMEESVKKASGENNKTLIQLTRIRKALLDINNQTDTNKRTQLIKEANKALGRTGDNLLTIEDDINSKVIPAIDEYINKIKEAAKQQAILSLVSEKTGKVLQLEAENAAYTEDENYGKTTTYNNWSPGGNYGGASMTVTTGLTKEALKLQNKVDKNNKEIDELNKGIDRIIKMADESTLAALYAGSDTVLHEELITSGGTSGGTKTKTPQSVLSDYKKSLTELDNQFKAGAILAGDYKKKVEELNQKTFEEFSAFGWDTAVKALATSADKALAEELRKTATAKLLEGLDDPEAIAEFDKEMDEEAKKSLDRFKEAWDKYIEYVKKKPVLGKVDSSDWYMYSGKPGKGQTYSERETHFNREYLNQYEKYVDDLESYRDDLKEALKNMTDPASIKRLNELLDQTIERLKNAKIEVKDLKTKANIAQIEKDIADLKKEGLDSVFSSITSVSDGMDRLYRAFQSIKQINDKTWNSEELENFLTGLNAIIQAFEVIKSIIEAVTAVTKVYEKIKEKQAAKAIALNAAEAASETAKGSAAAGAAAAGAASSTASIPIVGPILAVAAVAAVTAAILAGMKKFATGGFVGGNSYSGDKNLVRVNSGEMILNPAQQRNLLALANGQGNPNGKGQVDFKIRGDQLVGVLQNYNRLHK